MLLTVARANAFYDSSAFIAITGQVATTQYDSGALQEEYRHYQSDFPSIAKVLTKRSFQAQSVRRSRQVSPQGVQDRPHRPAGAGPHRRPYDLWVTKADVEVPEPDERSLCSTGARLDRRRRSQRRSRCCLRPAGR